MTGQQRQQELFVEESLTSIALTQSCQWCGDPANLFEIGQGNGPHAGRLICKNCRRTSRWMSKVEVEVWRENNA